MSADSFVHLHLHAGYSLLDGAVRIPELMIKAKALGMPTVAITDHGNLFGAIEFFSSFRDSIAERPCPRNSIALVDASAPDAARESREPGRDEREFRHAGEKLRAARVSGADPLP